MSPDTPVKVRTVLPPEAIVAVPLMVGVGNGLVDTAALPVMLAVHDVTVCVPTTVYVPVAVCEPKDIALPVPATGLPVADAPLYSWYNTDDSEPESPIATPDPPKQ